MPGIVCAIRGGPASQATIEKSIELAQESGQAIYFLYVVNLDFLSRSTSSKTERIHRDIKEMGEFILLDAREKAHQQGAQAEMVIKDGQVGEQIIDLTQELDAQYIVLGKPVHDNENNLFSRKKYQDFVDHLSQETQADVILSS